MGSVFASSGWRAVAPLPLPHSAPRSFGDHFETVVMIPLGVGALLEHSIGRLFGNEVCGILFASPQCLLSWFRWQPLFSRQFIFLSVYWPFSNSDLHKERRRQNGSE